VIAKLDGVKGYLHIHFVILARPIPEIYGADWQNLQNGQLPPTESSYIVTSQLEELEENSLFY
jgi:hypothetical protein